MLRDCVAAVSVGIVNGAPLLDLNYVEDSTADVDMNVVMTGAGRVRGGAGNRGARAVRPSDKLDALLALGGDGIARLVALQRRALESRGETTLVL